MKIEQSSSNNEKSDEEIAKGNEERKEKNKERNREYQRAWRQRNKDLKKKVSKEEKKEEKRKRHCANQRAYYHRTKALKENDKNVEKWFQRKLDDLQMQKIQFLTQQLRIYEESHKCITPKVILHRTTDIPGDGNCLFHSLIWVLQLQISTSDLRRQLRDSPYLNSCHNPQEAYKILSSNSEYGDLDCLYLFAKIYNQNICVHYHYFNVISKNEDTRFCHFKANDTHNWIHLDLRELHFTPYFSDDEKKKEEERKLKQKNREYSKRYRDKKRASNLQAGPSARDVLDVQPVIHTSQIAGLSTRDVSPEPLLFCRGCLVTGVRLFDLQSTELKTIFEEFVGKTRVGQAGYWLCACCAMLLDKFTQFRDRCRRAERAMWNLCNHNELNAHTVKSIDRTYHKLNLNLAISKPTYIGTDTILVDYEDKASRKRKHMEYEEEEEIKMKEDKQNLDEKEDVKLEKGEHIPSIPLGEERHINLKEGEDILIKEEVYVKLEQEDHMPLDEEGQIRLEEGGHIQLEEQGHIQYKDGKRFDVEEEVRIIIEVDRPVKFEEEEQIQFEEEGHVYSEEDITIKEEDNITIEEVPVNFNARDGT